MNMKVRSIWFSGCIFLSTTLTFGKEYKLWYNAPATVWEEALPIGNGRIGAMVYGNPLQEVYQLNEESIWSGYPQDWNNPKAANALPQVREAVDRGDYAKASELWKANAQGPYTARYLPMANLMLDQLTRGEARNLYRERSGRSEIPPHFLYLLSGPGDGHKNSRRPSPGGIAPYSLEQPAALYRADKRGKDTDPERQSPRLCCQS